MANPHVPALSYRKLVGNGSGARVTVLSECPEKVTNALSFVSRARSPLRHVLSPRHLRYDERKAAREYIPRRLRDTRHLLRALVSDKRGQ